MSNDIGVHPDSYIYAVFKGIKVISIPMSVYLRNWKHWASPNRFRNQNRKSVTKKEGISGEETEKTKTTLEKEPGECYRQAAIVQQFGISLNKLISSDPTDNG